jgi:hypothetical protein
MVSSVVSASPAAASNPLLPTGRLYTVAGGNDGAGGDGGPVSDAQFSDPGSLAFDANGNIYVADFYNNRVQFIAASNCSSGCPWGLSSTTADDVYTIAGQADGASGIPTNGELATDAYLGNAGSVALDTSGDLFVSDPTNDEVDEIAATTHAQFGISMTADHLYVLAGDGTAGSSGDAGPSTASELDLPGGLALDSNGDLFISDSYNERVQEIAASDGSQWGDVSMTAGDIYTVVGITGLVGDSGDGSPATEARLCAPGGIGFDPGGDLYVTDWCNAQVEEIPVTNSSQWGIDMTAGDIYTVAGTPGTTGLTDDDGLASSAELDYPDGVAFDADGDMFVTDAGNNRVMEVPVVTHTEWGVQMTADHIYAVAGSPTGQSGESADGLLATDSLFNAPGGVVITSDGDMYIADQFNNRIVLVPGSEGPNDIYTFAGNGEVGSSGDSGPATSAESSLTTEIAFDSLGDVYFVDLANSRLQEVAESDHTQWGIEMTEGDVYTIAGSPGGTTGDVGDGGPAADALFNGPGGIAIDGSGNIYIADAGNGAIREIAATTHTQWGKTLTAGDIYTVAGDGSEGWSPNGTSATSAELDYPYGVAIDEQGNLYISSSASDVVQEVAATTHTQWGQSMTAGDLYTLVGIPHLPGSMVTEARQRTHCSTRRAGSWSTPTENC